MGFIPHWIICNQDGYWDGMKTVVHHSYCMKYMNINEARSDLVELDQTQNWKIKFLSPKNFKKILLEYRD